MDRYMDMRLDICSDMCLDLYLYLRPLTRLADPDPAVIQLKNVSIPIFVYMSAYKSISQHTCL